MNTLYYCELPQEVKVTECLPRHPSVFCYRHPIVIGYRHLPVIGRLPQ